MRSEEYVFGKWFTKKKIVNHFPNFNKGFSGQRNYGNYFPFDYYFIVKQTLVNLKIFFKKYFTTKQIEPY